MPNIEVNMIAVLVAVVATFFLGFIWYTPLFGKIWAREMGMDQNEKPKTGQMIKGMVIMVIGNFLMAFVLGHDILAYNPVSWGLPPSEASALSTAGMASFFTWLGFFLPLDLNSVAWEGKSWTLFAINTSYHLVMLFVASIILVNM
ncbi:MAG TPA: DUF1761 domain-containing protein [Flavobacteriales bacterium]|nr:DUF1761 domain-containing protein [Flavobacteriales bacterium]